MKVIGGDRSQVVYALGVRSNIDLCGRCSTLASAHTAESSEREEEEEEEVAEEDRNNDAGDVNDARVKVGLHHVVRDECRSWIGAGGTAIIGWGDGLEHRKPRSASRAPTSRKEK